MGGTKGYLASRYDKFRTMVCGWKANTSDNIACKKKMASFQSSRDFHWSILSTQYLAHTGFPFVYGGAGGRDTPGDYQLSMHTGLSHIREIPAECESVWGKPENSTHSTWPHYWRARRTQQGTALVHTHVCLRLPLSHTYTHSHAHTLLLPQCNFHLYHTQTHPCVTMHHPSSWEHLRLAHWLKRHFFFLSLALGRWIKQGLSCHFSYEWLCIHKSLKLCSLSPFYTNRSNEFCL